MSLAEYLAKNYLTADQPNKKKKRKRTKTLDIIDDTTTSLPTNPTTSTNPNDDEDDLTEAQIVGDIIQDKSSISRENRWKSAVKFEDPDARPDEQPSLSLDAETQDALLMESGAKAGLQTAAEVKAAIDRKQKREMEEFKRSKLSGKELETTYRDATGRRLDQ